MIDAKRRFPGLQILRALAAVSVALEHITHDANVTTNDGWNVAAAIGGAMPWEAGIDVFFVISGFVIAHASADLFGAGASGTKQFLIRRVVRVVPMYWLTTTLVLFLVLLRPGSVNEAPGGPAFMAASYLFIPAARPDGVIHPLLSTGWTLNYEMFFYAVFACFLWAGRTGTVLCVTAALSGLVVMAPRLGVSAIPLRFWSDPIILEFLAGVWLRVLLPRLPGMSGRTRAALVASALVVLWWSNPVLGIPRVALWGLAGVLLVVAALAAEEEDASLLRRIGVQCGDASYALYLLHPFVMRLGSLGLRHGASASIIATLLYIGMSLGLSVAVAVAYTRYVDGPMTKAARRLLERR
jgi:peptidoglycan/LPS O-acetylase OafA/YrhL